MQHDTDLDVVLECRRLTLRKRVLKERKHSQLLLKTAEQTASVYMHLPIEEAALGGFSDSTGFSLLE